jgi:hypothetical protein
MEPHANQHHLVTAAAAGAAPVLSAGPAMAGEINGNGQSVGVRAWEQPTPTPSARSPAWRTATEAPCPVLATHRRRTGGTARSSSARPRLSARRRASSRATPVTATAAPWSPGLPRSPDPRGLLTQPNARRSRDFGGRCHARRRRTFMPLSGAVLMPHRTENALSCCSQGAHVGEREVRLHPAEPSSRAARMAVTRWSRSSAQAAAQAALRLTGGLPAGPGGAGHADERLLRGVRPATDGSYSPAAPMNSSDSTIEVRSSRSDAVDFAEYAASTTSRCPSTSRIHTRSTCPPL